MNYSNILKYLTVIQGRLKEVTEQAEVATQQLDDLEVQKCFLKPFQYLFFISFITLRQFSAVFKFFCIMTYVYMSINLFGLELLSSLLDIDCSSYKTIFSSTKSHFFTINVPSLCYTCNQDAINFNRHSVTCSVTVQQLGRQDNATLTSRRRVLSRKVVVQLISFMSL